MWVSVQSRSPRAGFVCLVLAVTLPMTMLLWPDSGTPSAGRSPNIVVIYTDDQEEGGLEYMPKVRRLLVDRGTRFTNSLVTTSLCCPSRVSFLTGKYAHNHRVLSNLPPRGGWRKFRRSAGRSLPVWLQRAGYRTAWIGKYLNGYRGTSNRVPPGWNRWFGQVGTSVFDYRLNQNGRLVHYGSKPTDYRTDVYSRLSNRVVRGFAERDSPFFLVVSTGVPHTEHGADVPPGSNPRPAPRHDGVLADLGLPGKPNFNEQDVSDKPPNVASLPLLDRADVDVIEERYRSRLESMLAVDDLVASLVSTLSAIGELDRTIIVFTSDNGYFFGEHRIANDKRQVYEESIRVPLVIRGPGVPAGDVRTGIAANVDLAPTFLDIARARRPRRKRLDGHSLWPLLEWEARRGRRALLIEYFRSREAPRAATYRAVRTNRYVFARYRNGFRELYDLAADPYQLQNVASESTYASARRSLAAALSKLRDCDGRACRVSLRTP